MTLRLRDIVILLLVLLSVFVFWKVRKSGTTLDSFSSKEPSPQPTPPLAASNPAAGRANSPTLTAKKITSLPLPAPDSKPWNARDYERVKGAAAGVLAVQNGDKLVYALYSELTPHRCKTGNDFCIRFPNSQDIIYDKDKLGRLPLRWYPEQHIPNYVPSK